MLTHHPLNLACLHKDLNHPARQGTDQHERQRLDHDGKKIECNITNQATPCRGLSEQKQQQGYSKEKQAAHPGQLVRQPPARPSLLQVDSEEARGAVPAPSAYDRF